MLNGWTVPAVFIFVASQATAAIWWASGTHTKVEDNTIAIVQIAENEKSVAIIQVQQAEIVKDIAEIKATEKEIMAMLQSIYKNIDGWNTTGYE